ncbi:secreted frizzled-related protein 5 [Protopterus annectens]|uniref:secreted frizzled-related protein 5 n=1 Tax=Protopterus annectens TaxID=7888 RepID=UPI001CFACBFB|nr:secreted frizzled-related protein 5 [Protopterus annectens]
MSVLLSCHWNFVGIIITLSLGPSLPGRADDSTGEYYSWQYDNSHVRFNSKQTQCMDIPMDLRLCYNVGYQRMRLPNLLDHETLPEVRQQASSWVPLLAKRCHADTQLFLCSLFAPVCLDRPIYPCRSLCEAVRDSCAPVMESYGFPWPEMLKCDKFPIDNDLCITVQFSDPKNTPQPGPNNICPPCDNELKTDILRDQFCASDFVVKLKIKETTTENGDRKLLTRKRKKILKLGTLNKRELREMVIYLKNGSTCQCHQLDQHQNDFLIMGRKVAHKFILTFIHKWERKSMSLRSFKYFHCPSFHSTFQ